MRMRGDLEFHEGVPIAVVVCLWTSRAGRFWRSICRPRSPAWGSKRPSGMRWGASCPCCLRLA